MTAGFWKRSFDVVTNGPLCLCRKNRRLSTSLMIMVIFIWHGPRLGICQLLTRYALIYSLDKKFIYCKLQLFHAQGTNHYGTIVLNYFLIVLIYQVILESLRMASIISFTFREAVTDVKYKGMILCWGFLFLYMCLCYCLFLFIWLTCFTNCTKWFRTGYLIPKGWKVMPLFRNIHHNPEFFPDPQQFDPSRFEVCYSTGSWLLGSCHHYVMCNCIFDIFLIMNVGRTKTKYVHAIRKWCACLSWKWACQARNAHHGSPSSH